MTNPQNETGFGLPPRGDASLEIRTNEAILDPTKRLIRYIGDYVRITKIPEGGFEAIGKIIASNSGEVLLLPYVSVLPVPGKSPLIDLVNEGKPLSIRPGTIDSIQVVPNNYPNVFVSGLRKEHYMGSNGDEKNE